MNCKNYSKIFTLWTLIHISSSAFASQPFPHQNSDLQLDPSVTIGTLANGMRYAIMPNQEPPQKVSIRLLVRAGSLMESEQQQGLAHFLEHMAFNGSTHYPAGTLVEYLQNLGMGFGSHNNAHTSFLETVYKLELPNNEPAILQEGLQVMRDYADGLLLGQTEIEKERGVIINEKNSRDTVSYRTFESTWAYLFDGSLFPQRFPIGQTEIIEQANRQDFVDFYQKWYHPALSALVIVGDVDPQQIAPLIEKQFASWHKENPAPHIHYGTLKQRPLNAFLHTEEEAKATEISIVALSPDQTGNDRIALRQQQILRNLAHYALNQRLEKISQAEGTPWISAAAYQYDLYRFAQIAAIEGQCAPENWPATLQLLENELRRAYQFGFTPSEIELGKASLLNQLEQGVKSKDSRQSRALANALTDSLSDDDVFTSPEDNLQLGQDFLATVSPQDVHQAFQALWQEQIGAPSIIASGNLALDDAPKQLTQEFQKARSIAVAAPINETVAPFAYPSSSQHAGSITQRYRHESLDSEHITFANNVRLNLKATDFAQDSIQVQINFGGGKLSQSPSQAGLAMITSMAFQAGGLEAHSNEELQKILSGKTVDLRFRIAQDRFILSGQTNQKDSLTLLELMQAYLSHPGYRPEALRIAHKELEPYYKNLSSTLSGAMQKQVTPFLTSGDIRHQVPNRQQVEQYSLSDIQHWLQPALTDSYLEIAIVGDFDTETIIQQVAQTLGTLPTRANRIDLYTDQRELHFPRDTHHQTFHYPSKLPQAYAATYWPTTDDSNTFLSRRMHMLARILDDRLRKTIREEYGDAYSPNAYSDMSRVYPQYGYITASSQVTPGTSDKVSQLMLEIGQQIAQEGISEEEFNRSKKPLIAMLADYRRNNNYWLSRVLADAQAKPIQLKWASNMVDDYHQMTHHELDAYAKQYLQKNTAIRVQVEPKSEQ